jgi:heat shock protein HspQ
MTYLAYVSEQNLLLDDMATPLRHPDIVEHFIADANGGYRLRPGSAN